MDKENIKKLIKEAISAREYSYSPYSKIRVGAALITKEGKIFKGTNIENASYGLTICAERVAIFNAVSNGYKDIKAIAIVYDENELGYPCGACRQVISEFSDNDDTLIIMANLKGEYKVKTIGELLPFTFKIDE